MDESRHCLIVVLPLLAGDHIAWYRDLLLLFHRPSTLSPSGPEN